MIEFKKVTERYYAVFKVDVYADFVGHIGYDDFDKVWEFFFRDELYLSALAMSDITAFMMKLDVSKSEEDN